MIGWTTVGTAVAANVLARSLIENDLVACVQIDGPITSLYRWDDEIESTSEFRLMVKFLSDQAEALETHLLTAHPYENPEWITAETTHVTEKYLSWAKANSNPLSL